MLQKFKERCSSNMEIVAAIPLFPSPGIFKVHLHVFQRHRYYEKKLEYLSLCGKIGFLPNKQMHIGTRVSSTNGTACFKKCIQSF
jgi:hypothetical protein